MGTLLLTTPSGSASGAADKQHTFLGEPASDTLDATPQVVLPFARQALEDDDWQIDTARSDGPILVTLWKPFQHPLLRLTMGKVVAKCEVKVDALGGDRSVVWFRAGLTSSKNMQKYPIYPLAVAAYENAVRDYYKDLKNLMDRHSTESTAPPSVSKRAPTR